MGLDSSEGSVTRYRLEGPVIESPWWSRLALRSTQPPTQRLSGLPRRRGVDHPPLSSAEVKERVQLFLYSPLDLHVLL